MPNDFPDWSTPNTFITNQLFSGTVDISNPILGLDVSLWASLTIRIQSSSSDTAWNIQWEDSVGNFFGFQQLSCGTLQNYTITIPALGAFFNMVCVASSPFDIIIIEGSTRPCETPKFNTSPYLPRAFSKSGAWVAGTAQALVATDAGDPFTCLNGQCTISCQTVGVSGSFQGRYIQQNAVATTIGVSAALTPGVVQLQQFQHPLTPITYLFTPSANSASGFVFLQISGSG